jgi:ferric-dicitrate binding protein FerR (iron transport regulator)
MDKHLIEKFFSGRATEEEAGMVLLWYLSNELDDSTAAEFETYWNEHYERTDWDAEKKYAELENKIMPAVPDISVQQAPRPVRRMQWLLKAAAVLVLVTGGLHAALFWPGGRTGAAVTIVSTNAGERRVITLPDSSRVHLQGNSRISYQSGLSGKTRLVELEGEGYFDVKADASRPFVVQSGGVITQVLGTAFNVRYDTAFHSPDSVKVYLVSGKVSVSRSNDEADALVLSPGQFACTGPENSLRNGRFDPKEVQWIDGLLYFNAMPFREVLAEVEQWYGVRVTLKGNAGKRLYSGEFRNETLGNVLESMAFSGAFSYQISGNDVQITFEDRN